MKDSYIHTVHVTLAARVQHQKNVKSVTYKNVLHTGYNEARSRIYRIMKKNCDKT